MTPRWRWTGKKHPAHRGAVSGDDDIEALTDPPPPPDRSRGHPAGGANGWRPAARPVVGGQMAATATIVPIRHPGDAPATAPLHPERGAGLVHPLPGYDMPLPRLRPPRPALRYRPHHRLPRRPHPGVEPEMSVPKTPPTQNLRRLARPTMARRHRHLDLTARADLHHPPREPTAVPHPVPTHRSSRYARDARHYPGTTNCGLMMPRRTHTRAQNRNKAINDERRYNARAIQTDEGQAAEPNRPPPF